MPDSSAFACSRRDWLRATGLGAASLAAASLTGCGHSQPAASPAATPAPPQESAAVRQDRLRRMQWWHQARFGMFIHWGLYSVLGRHEWAMEMEGIPVKEYEQLAKRFRPQPHAARAWARLAKAAGQKYMVMTT